MTIDHPARLIVALIAVGFLTLLYDLLQRRATDADLAYSNIAFFSQAIRPRAWIPPLLQALWIAGLTCVAVAAGGPHLSLPKMARDGQVFICIDTSGSMVAADVEPTRFNAAKAAARAFIAQTPQGTKIGIIAFSASANVVAPLSSDHAQVIASLDDIPLPNGATAIGDALQVAAQHLPSRGHRVVVLITDGVNNTGSDPVEAARWLGAHHVPVYTVGIGTPAGGVIPGTSEMATIDEAALRRYADLSGGAYARAENATQLYDALARLGRVTALQRTNVDAALGFALSGAVILSAAFFTGFGLGRYP